MAWPPRHRLAGKIRKSHGTFDTWPWVVVYRKSLPCADKQQGQLRQSRRYRPVATMLEYAPLNAAMKPDTREVIMIKIPAASMTASGTASLLLSMHASAARLALPRDATARVQRV